MRIFLSIFVLAILTACGTSKIRYVRSKGEPQKVIQQEERNQLALKEVEKTSSSIVEEAITSTEEDVAPTYSEVEDLFESIVEIEENVTVADDEPKTVDKDKIYAALRAEQNAKRSKALLISSTATFIASVILPFAFLAAIILYVIGNVYYTRANNSRYITLEGERHLRVAEIFNIISIVLMILAIIAIGVILALLFL